LQSPLLVTSMQATHVVTGGREGPPDICLWRIPLVANLGKAMSNTIISPVTGVFCEPFSAADAIRRLTESGFADHEIDLLGVLSGRPPNLIWFLRNLGLPHDHAEYCNACLSEGAVLVMVQIPPSYASRKRKIARRVLKQHGGVLPPEPASAGLSDLLTME
jgi:hypothetical protein